MASLKSVKTLSLLIGRKVVFKVKNVEFRGTPIKYHDAYFCIFLRPGQECKKLEFIDREKTLVKVHHEDIIKFDTDSSIQDLVGLNVVCQKKPDIVSGKVIEYVGGFFRVQLDPREDGNITSFNFRDQRNKIIDVHKANIIEVLSDPYTKTTTENYGIGQRVVCYPLIHNYHGIIKNVMDYTYRVQVDDYEDVRVSTIGNNEIVVLKDDVVCEKEPNPKLIGKNVICQKFDREFAGAIVEIRYHRYVVSTKEEIPFHCYFDEHAKTILADEIEFCLKDTDTDNSREVERMEVDDEQTDKERLETNYEGFPFCLDDVVYLLAVEDVYQQHVYPLIRRGEIVAIKNVARSDDGYFKIKCMNDGGYEMTISVRNPYRVFIDLSEEEYMIMLPMNPDDRLSFYHNGGLSLCKLFYLGSRVFVKSKYLFRNTDCIIRYIGQVDKRPGTWYGVELLETTSRGDSPPGFCEGKRYFECQKSLFVTANFLSEDSKAPLIKFKKGDIVKWESEEMQATEIGSISSIIVASKSTAVITRLGIHTPDLGFLEAESDNRAVQPVIPIDKLDNGLHLLPSVETLIDKKATIKLNHNTTIRCTIIDVDSSSEVVVETDETLTRNISKYRLHSNPKKYGDGKSNRIAIISPSNLEIFQILDYPIRDKQVIQKAIKKDLANKQPSKSDSLKTIKPTQTIVHGSGSRGGPSTEANAASSQQRRERTAKKTLHDICVKTFETIRFEESILTEKHIKTNDPVVIKLDTDTFFGTVRWSGIIDDYACAGIELDEDNPVGSDGSFFKQQLFHCKDKRGILVPVHLVVKNTEAIPGRSIESDNSSMNYTSEFYSSLKPKQTSSVDELNNLTIDSCVVVNIENDRDRERNGRVMYLGFSDEHEQLFVGCELEYPYLHGTDGTFDDVKLFNCKPGYGVLVPISNVKLDDRFDKAVMEESKKIPLPEYYNSKYTEEELAGARALKSVSGRTGLFKGIQGCYNSCYMDSTIYAMYAFNSSFDYLINRPNCDDRTMDLQRLLANTIVAPLRCRNHFVNSSMMVEFRSKLETLMSEKRQHSAGFQYEEKDPEEFLNCLFSQVLKCDPLLKFDNKQEGFMYQVFLEEGSLKKEYPSTQELLTMSLNSNCAKFVQPPSTLILLLPRHGRDYRMFSHIVLSPELDLTFLLTNTKYSYPCLGVGRKKGQCPKMASYRCDDCFLRDFSEDSFFCEDCWQTSQHDKKNHKKFPLESCYPKAHPKLELFAVLSIETSHYVSFVKTGKGNNAKWILFDSMAGRKDEMNVPEVTVIPEINNWLDKPQTIGKNSAKRTIIEKRLFSDTYMCFYRNPDVDIYG